MTEINKYNSSKIYKICSNLTNNIYIGSTTQSIKQRLSEHVKNYKQYIRTNNKYTTSYEIIKLGDYYITLIEEHNYNNKQQLFKREGEVMKLNINNIVNNRIAGECNGDKAEYMKQYYNNNKEQVTEYHKQHYNNNKEHIAEQNKQAIICECGSTITKQHKLRHMKSTRHINLIQQLFNNELTYYN